MTDTPEARAHMRDMINEARGVLPPGHGIVPGEPSLPYLAPPALTLLKGQQHPEATTHVAPEDVVP